MRNEGGGGAKIANARHLARIVVIDVLLSLNLAAILKTCVSVSMKSVRMSKHMTLGRNS
jgi:hypothetical protein